MLDICLRVKVNMRTWYHLLSILGTFWYAIHIILYISLSFPRIIPKLISKRCVEKTLFGLDLFGAVGFSSKDQNLSQESDESDCRKVMGGTMSTECPPSRRQTRTDLSRNTELRRPHLSCFPLSCFLQFSMMWLWHLGRVTKMYLR